MTQMLELLDKDFTACTTTMLQEVRVSPVEKNSELENISGLTEK